MAKRYWINYLKEYIFTPSAPANDTTSQTGTFKAVQERVLNRLADAKGVPWYQSSPTTLSAASSHISEDASTAHGGSIQATQKDGTGQTFRATYNFTGPGVTVADDSTNSRTNIDIPGGGGGGSAHVIQEEGTSLTARTRLNFRGVGATASDDSGNDRSNVDIRGNVHRSGTAPTSPVAGELWLDTATTPATLRSYNGSAWVVIKADPTDGSVLDVHVGAGANITKSKLGNLAIDRSDMATDRTILVTCTSATRPSNPATGQAIYETDTQNVFVNTGTPSTPVWTAITATSSYQAQDFISGVELTWDAANTLGIETGAAYIPGSSSVLEIPTRLTRAITFAASQTVFSHVYLFDNGGSPDILVTTDSPTAPYRGKGRTKAAGSTAASTLHRYLGSILPDGTATPAMYRWQWFPGNEIQYTANTVVAPFARIANSNVGTGENTISCSGTIPPTSFRGLFDIDRLGQASLYFGHSQDNISLPSNQGLFRMFQITGTGLSTGADSQTMAWLPLDTSQAFTYRFSSATNGLWLSVLGYQLER